LTEAVVQQDKKSLSLICNDTAFPNVGVGKWIVGHQVSRAIVSHIGTNPETGRQIFSKELQVDLVPQGTLALRINAGGSGLGGVLTPTGVGTIVEEGKQKLTVNGKEYLLELPLRSDEALLYAAKADKAGNLVFRRSARNFNPIMAMAADCVIVEAGEIVEPGEIDPDEVMIPGVVVDWIIP
jgi:acetate CoA/acetoacetate CoA-transferase alpha subunit